MLKIQNYERLENQRIGTEWEVASIYERLSTYTITITTPIFPYQRVIELSRFVEFNNNGIGHYFFFNEQGKKTHTSLRLEQIGDMNNILKALNWFTL